jgi:uncharacterized DUF497 family protein
MEYEWDPRKAETNVQKHRVDFADAVSVFSDEGALTIPDDYPDEERVVTIGVNALGRLLVVVYTWRNDTIRILSARPPTRSERKQYEG